MHVKSTSPMLAPCSVNTSPSPAAIDFSENRPGCSIKLVFKITTSSERVDLHFDGTEKCADVVEFLRNRWGESTGSNASIIYCGKRAYGVKQVDGTHQHTGYETIQELMSGMGVDRNNVIHVAFRSPKTDQNANSSSSYVDPSGATVQAHAGELPATAAPRDAESSHLFTPSMFIDFARKTFSQAD